MNHITFYVIQEVTVRFIYFTVMYLVDPALIIESRVNDAGGLEYFVHYKNRKFHFYISISLQS